MGITGRGRKDQMKMARESGIKDYASPAGGGCCFLTDKQYSDKLVNLWQARNSKEYEFDNIMLLKIGRHICFKPEYKLIIGREECESNYLKWLQKSIYKCLLLIIYRSFDFERW